MVFKHKYNSKVTLRDSIKFPSKAEAKYYDNLMLMKKSGDVVFFIRQPMFDMGGGCTYKADFMVFYKNGDIRVVDVKGARAGSSWDAFLVKKKIVESRYPVEIELEK